jgi:hypothetical protein
VAEDPEVAAAVAQTLPAARTEAAWRRKLWGFVRRLKALPQTRDLAPAALRPVVRYWHDAARAAAGGDLAFEETWGRFLEAWPRVEHAAGAGPFDRLWEESAAAKQPRAARGYDDPRMRRLVTFCWLLQRHAGARPFALDCRRVAALLGVHHATVWRWLRLVLVSDEVLRLVARGSRATARANEWRFIGK